MRARNLKPGFFENEELADLGPYAQVLFGGLWCLADREGKLKDRPRRIQAQVFPYYSPKPSIENLLNSLAKGNFIYRYEIEGIKLIKIINFLTHQAPHHTEKKSVLPDPPPKVHGELTEGSPLCSSENPPDSLNHESGIMNHDSVAHSLPTNDLDPDFLQFWEAYPKKTGKQDAASKWKSLKKKKMLPKIGVILAAVKDQVSWEQWQKDDGQFIPNPATWLNQGRWDDKPPVVERRMARVN